MTPEEEKAAEEAAKAEAEAKAKAEAEAKAKENIDYKAELEREREHRARAEKAIETERARRLKAEADHEKEMAQGQQFDEERVRAIASEEATRRLGRSEALAVIASRTQDPAERELILEHYDHSIVPSGNIVEDVDRAWALANRRRIQADLEETRRSLASEQTKSPGGGAGQPEGAKPIVALTPEEEKLVLIHPPEKREEVRKKMLAQKAAVA